MSPEKSFGMAAVLNQLIPSTESCAGIGIVGLLCAVAEDLLLCLDPLQSRHCSSSVLSLLSPLLWYQPPTLLW